MGLILINGCTQLGGPAGGSGGTPSGDQYGFTMDCPQGWTKKSGSETGAAVVLLMLCIGPADGGVTSNINVVKEAVGTLTLAQYIAATKGMYKSVGIETFSAEGNTMLGGKEAYYVELVQNAAGKTMKQKQIYSVSGGQAYVVTLTSSEDGFEAAIQTFDASVNTFKFAISSGGTGTSDGGAETSGGSSDWENTAGFCHEASIKKLTIVTRTQTGLAKNKTAAAKSE